MTNPSVSIEDYLGAIYRLQRQDGSPLPLGDLQEHFGFSPISIHEMIQKLVQRGLVEYLPYKGVVLTPSGSAAAAALVRRHRIWECFLTDGLQVPIDEAHSLAHDLEHAAPDWITERLFTHLLQPEVCPHGNLIQKIEDVSGGITLDTGEAGQVFKLLRIFPEKAASLQLARETGLLPGEVVRIRSKDIERTSLEIRGMKQNIFTEDLASFWGLEINNES